MGSNTPDRRAENTDRRRDGAGKPPPGTVVDRRLGIDRRDLKDPRPAERAQDNDADTDHTDAAFTGLERRRGRGRRLSEFTKSAEEGEMNTEQFLFLMAIDAFKKSNDRMFPTWTDVLEVIRLLGYRKTMPSELNLPAAEDWLERSDSPANVRPDRWAERFTQSDGHGIGLRKLTPKTEQELTDEALEAFEAAFGDDEIDADFESDLDSGLSDAA